MTSSLLLLGYKLTLPKCHMTCMTGSLWGRTCPSDVCWDSASRKHTID